jgi:thymidylate synthase
MMIAQVSDLKVGNFVHTFGDAHIYSNHLEQVDKQLERSPQALPQMHLNPKITSLFDFRYEDFRLEGYAPDPGIRAPVAV